MRLHLGGHLSWYDPQKRSWLELSLPEPVALIELVRQLELPVEEIAISVVNGHAVSLEEARVSDGDRVELYPPIGGGSRLRHRATRHKSNP
jgi:sulfur carrier protein ThiS